MRGALEAAAVRVAPSMKPQNVANTIWGLATMNELTPVTSQTFGSE